jgi:hypothetical protein
MGFPFMKRMEHLRIGRLFLLDGRAMGRFAAEAVENRTGSDGSQCRRASFDCTPVS